MPNKKRLPNYSVWKKRQDVLRARAKKMRVWLNNHPLINRHALCQKLGTDTSNLHKALEGYREISVNEVALYENELAKYGFKKPAIWKKKVTNNS